MIVKWMGFGIGVAGTIIGAITAHLELGNFFHGVQVGSPYWTIAAITVGFLASLLLLWKPKVAAGILLAVAIFGAIGNYTMWEGPGTFYLASALIAYTNARASRVSSPEVVSPSHGQSS